MTTLTAAPDLPATLLSRAAQQLTALADPDRVTLLAAVLHAEPAGPVTVTGLAADRRTDVRVVVRQLAALESAGLVRVTGHQVRAATQTLGETATALTAALPVAALLRDEPDLDRFCSHGRLLRLPLANRVDERRRLAAALVRLLPADRSLSEPEVNAVLAEVMDDVAALRRFLVEEGVLTRRGAEDYRRVDG